MIQFVNSKKYLHCNLRVINDRIFGSKQALYRYNVSFIKLLIVFSNFNYKKSGRGKCSITSKNLFNT